MESFWFLHGLSNDADISSSKFSEIFEKTFGQGTPSGTQWSKLWQYFGGNNTISVQSISKELKKYVA